MVDKIAALFKSDEGKKVYETILSTIDECNMLPMLKNGVLVGLSGGADSVFLLLFLIRYRECEKTSFPIVAVHINHGIRGSEAERDQSFCKELCDMLGVDLLVREFDIPTIAKESKTGIEEAARQARYRAFSEIISSRNNVSTIAVAHNRSDNAETVIFNILRGSGARGGAGIRSVRDNIIRPLIRVSKESITSLLDSAGLPYVIDSTNLSSDYNRNYLRREIIPKLAKVTSNPEKMIARFADNIRCDDDFITDLANEFLSSRSVVKNKELKSLHPALFIRVISSMASSASASISSSIARDIYNLLDKDNFSYSLIGNVNFICERGSCFIANATPETTDYCYSVDIGITTIDRFNSDFVLSSERLEKTYSNVYKISIQANLSSAIISGSLYLRSKMDGDTIFYGGMTHKLKKLFSDRKIPVNKRKLIPILCDDKGVVWVPGFGVRDDHVSKENKSELYALIGIKSFDDNERFWFDTE